MFLAYPSRTSRGMAFGLAVLFILLASPARADILFDGEWDGFGEHFDRKDDASSWTVDNVPGHWHMIQALGLDRITAVSDLDSPKHAVVARVEVRPGDTGFLYAKVRNAT